jgi:hypothetical protein
MISFFFFFWAKRVMATNTGPNYEHLSFEKSMLEDYPNPMNCKCTWLQTMSKGHLMIPIQL